MTYFYIKAAHIIFVVTWFAGLFYVVRLLVYNTEANERSEPGRSILQNQFAIMIRRLWYGITWPSALITLALGIWIWSELGTTPGWLKLKLAFVAGLYGYHFTLHLIVTQQMNGVFRFSSFQLRLWNEVATVFLVSIVILVVVKQSLSVAWGLAGLILLIILLMSAVGIYKLVRSRKK